MSPWLPTVIAADGKRNEREGQPNASANLTPCVHGWIEGESSLSGASQLGLRLRMGLRTGCFFARQRADRSPSVPSRPGISSLQRSGAWRTANNRRPAQPMTFSSSRATSCRTPPRMFCRTRASVDSIGGAAAHARYVESCVELYDACHVSAYARGRLRSRRPGRWIRPFASALTARKEPVR